MAADNELLEIYTDESGAFTVGRIVACEGGDIAVEGVDEQGRRCGYYVMPEENVLGTRQGTPYLAKIRRYMEYGDAHPCGDWYSLPAFPEGSGGGLLTRVLRAALDSGELITVGAGEEEDPVCGYVRAFSHGKLTMETVDPESAGTQEVRSLRVRDIGYIEYGSIDDRLLQYANEHQ